MEGATQAAVSTIDFTEAFTNALNGISADFGKYALIVVPIGLGIWAAPKVIRLATKFFNSLAH